MTEENIQIYLEYAHPKYVPLLMSEVFSNLNALSQEEITLKNAHKYYAKIHPGLAHIHPFGDGNGRIARLMGYMPLLRAGLPPIVIPAGKRREYIQILAKYELMSGTLSNKTGVWPDMERLAELEEFCRDCYQATLNIIAAI